MTEEEAGPRRRTIVLAATPGMLAHFGPIEIVGQRSVGENVIRRQLTFKPGERFTRREMRESQRKLYGSSCSSSPTSSRSKTAMLQPPEVPVRVTVPEGKHRKVTTGVGYGTEEQARARLRWDHVNFFGGAQHAGFEGEVVVARSRRARRLPRAVLPDAGTCR